MDKAARRGEANTSRAMKATSGCRPPLYAGIDPILSSAIRGSVFLQPQAAFPISVASTTSSSFPVFTS